MPRKLLLLLSLFCPMFALGQSSYYNANCSSAPSTSPAQCAAVLAPGGTVVLFSNVQPTTGAHSQQIYIQPTQTQPSPNVAFEFAFSGNPGTLNYQIEDATTDLTGNYVTVPLAGTLTTVPVSEGGSYIARIELNPFMGRYARIYVSAATANAVNVTVTATR